MPSDLKLALAVIVFVGLMAITIFNFLGPTEANAQLPMSNMRMPGSVFLMRPVEIDGVNYKAVLFLPCERNEIKRYLDEFDAVRESEVH